MIELLLWLISTVFLFKQQIVPPQITQSQNPTHIVCIDPGHGKDGPGASNGNLVEMDLTLDISNRLKTLLEKNNYNQGR
jgi:N-acetylmuramoyl-L-alanine amidase